jgi:hypothetical protein
MMLESTFPSKVVTASSWRNVFDPTTMGSTLQFTIYGFTVTFNFLLGVATSLISDFGTSNVG